MDGVKMWCETPLLQTFVEDVTACLLVIESNEILTDSPKPRHPVTKFYEKALGSILKSLINEASSPLLSEIEEIANAEYVLLLEVAGELKQLMADFFMDDYYCKEVTINETNHLIGLTLLPPGEKDV